MSKAARIADRRGLGGVRATVRMPWPWWLVVMLVVPALIVVAVPLVNHVVAPAIAWAAVAAVLLPYAFFLWVLLDRRMVVCDGGVIIGGFAPGAAPFVLPWSMIEPRGVTAVEDLSEFPRVCGESMGSTLFHTGSSRQGLVFDGPLAATVRQRPPLLGVSLDSGVPNTVRGGKLWTFAHGRSHEEIVGLWEAAMLSAGVPHADQLRSCALPPRRLGAGEAINGLVPRPQAPSR